MTSQKSKMCPSCKKEMKSNICCGICRASSIDSLDDLETLEKKDSIIKKLNTRKFMLERIQKIKKGGKSLVCMTI